MSQFYAEIPTSARKTVPTARGHKSTGISTLACSASGFRIRTTLWTDEQTGEDMYRVVMEPHHYNGASTVGHAVLAEGKCSDWT